MNNNSRVRIYLFNPFLRIPPHQQLWAVYERINKLTVKMQDIHAGKEKQNQYRTVNNDNYITLTQPHTHTFRIEMPLFI